MSEYDNTNSGALFVNDKQRPGKQDADRTGSLNVGGVDYWINGWLKESKAGVKFLSLSVRPKDGEAKPKARTRDAGDDDEPLPF